MVLLLRTNIIFVQQIIIKTKRNCMHGNFLDLQNHEQKVHNIWQIDSLAIAQLIKRLQSLTFSYVNSFAVQ